MAIEKKFVREQINRLLIAEFLKNETERAGFGGIDIQRTPMGTRVSLIAERPGMIIGRRGSNINRLTTELAENFAAENPQIEVVEAGRDANLNAQIMARKVAEALERGWHFRRAGHSTVRRIMESGAKGCIVILSGKLTGQRHRIEKFIQGHIKYNGDTALNLMDVGYAQCKKKLGTIGCTVKIMHPDARLPDEVEIYAPGEKAAKAEAARRPKPAPAPKPAADAPAPEAAKPAGEEERTERRSRRREPAPQLTEADIAEAKAHHAKQQAEKAAKDTPAAKPEAPKAPAAKPAAEAKAAEPKAPAAKPAVEAKAAEPKAPAAKPAVEAKAAEPKAPAAKPAGEAKAPEPKAPAAKPAVEAKAAEPKAPAAAKPAAEAPANETDKPKAAAKPKTPAEPKAADAKAPAAEKPAKETKKEDESS